MHNKVLFIFGFNTTIVVCTCNWTKRIAANDCRPILAFIETDKVTIISQQSISRMSNNYQLAIDAIHIKKVFQKFYKFRIFITENCKRQIGLNLHPLW